MPTYERVREMYRESLGRERYRQVRNQAIYGVDWNDPPAEEPEPDRSEEEVAKLFSGIMAQHLEKKPQSMVDRVAHEAELGWFDEYKAKQEEEIKKLDAKPQPNRPRLLCGVCGDPLCPWSE